MISYKKKQLTLKCTCGAEWGLIESIALTDLPVKIYPVKITFKCGKRIWLDEDISTVRVEDSRYSYWKDLHSNDITKFTRLIRPHKEMILRELAK